MTRPVRVGGSAVSPSILVAVAVFAAIPAFAAEKPASGTAGDSKAPAEAAKLSATLLARHKGATEARIVSLMGASATTTPHDGGRRLEWNSPGGVGDPSSIICRLTADFTDGRLAALEIAGSPQFDHKVCRKLARPLLDASAPADAHGGRAAITTLTNDSIVDLVKGGYPPEAILAKIRNEPCKFDLSNEGLIALRRAGVKEPIIQAMIDRGCS